MLHIALYIALYIVTGLFVGTIAGLIGLGGGVFIVPALAMIFHQAGFPPSVIMHMAAGSSLVIIALTAQASVRAHMHHGDRQLIWSIYHPMIAGIIIGAIVGAIISNFLHTKILSILFGLFLITVSLKMFMTPREKAETNKEQGKLPGFFWRSIVSLIIGGKSGLLGVGGGALMIPFLTMCKVPMRATAGVSALCSLTVSIIGGAVFIMTGWHQADLPAWSTGYVYWPAVICIAIPSMIAAPFGARLTYKAPVIVLRRIFAVLLLATGIHMLWP